MNLWGIRPEGYEWIGKQNTHVFAESSAGEEARDRNLLVVLGQGGATDGSHAVGVSAIGDPREETLTTY